MDVLTLLVCPHDTANNPVRWQMLAQYIAQRLSLHIQFDIMLDFTDFHEHMNTADLVYANPLDTLQLTERQGFVALAHPAGLYDEAVLIANHDIETPTLAMLEGQPIASVEQMLPTNIALYLLKRQAITPSSIINHDSWMSVIGSVWRNETSFGIVYKDTYQELSDQGKGMVQAFYTTEECIAFHSMLLGNRALANREEIEQGLLQMHLDEKGQEVLADLPFAQWLPTNDESLAMMKQIITT